MVAGRGSSLRWSRGMWAVRTGLALLAVALGYQSVTYSMAVSAQRTDPARAHALAPGDGRIMAALAATKFAVDQSPRAQVDIAQLAQRALRQDPMVVQAVATLGLQAQLRGDTAKARRLFDYAGMLSRRELQVQLWAIEDAIGRGDIPGTLRQYDVALRTSKTAPDLLFPVLGGAIGEREVRRNLVATLAKRPSWMGDFITYVANFGDPPAVAALLVDLRRAGVALSADTTRVVITRLVQAGAPMLAWRYYATVRASADRRMSRDPQFAARLDVPTPFDWVVVNEAGVSASLGQGEKGGFVDFAAPPSVGGDVVRQLQLLPRGRYRIEGRTRNIDQPARSAPYWSLSCWQGRELGRVEVSASATTNGYFSGVFNVPRDCSVQMLTLVVRASDTVGGVSGQIDQTRLVPMP